MRAAVLASTSALLVLTAAPTPAHGASETFADPVDTPGGVDVVAAKVKHESRVKIVLRHAGMDDAGAVDVTYWLDTRPGDAGPEYRIWLAANSDGFEVSRVDGWRDRGAVVECGRRGARADVFSDRPIVMWVHRSCVGGPKKVRVGAKVRNRQEGETAVDWVPAKRTFTGWVKRG